MLIGLYNRLTSALRTTRRRLYYLLNGRHQSFPHYLSYNIEGHLKNSLYHEAAYQHDQWGRVNGYHDYYALMKTAFVGLFGRANRYEWMNQNIARGLYSEAEYGPASRERNWRFG